MEEILRYLQRPFKDREWIKKIGIGGIIGFIPVLNLCLAGYLLEWIKSVNRKSKGDRDVCPLPEWKDPGRLLADGLILFLICLSYFLAPLVVLGIGRLLMRAGGTSAVLGQLFKFLAGLGAGVVSFILPIIVIQFASSGNIADAYKIKSIGEKLAGVFAEYMVAYLFSLGLIFTGWIVIAILSPVLLLGYIILPILNFYIGLVVSCRFAEILSESGG